MNPRRLYRSHDRRLAGVAGGMAEYLDIDPTVVRVLWVIAAFASAGLAFLAYIVFALVIPNAPWSYPPAGSQWYGAPGGSQPMWGPGPQAQGWGSNGAQPTGWGAAPQAPGVSQPTAGGPAWTPAPATAPTDPSQAADTSSATASAPDTATTESYQVPGDSTPA